MLDFSGFLGLLFGVAEKKRSGQKCGVRRCCVFMCHPVLSSPVLAVLCGALLECAALVLRGRGRKMRRGRKRKDRGNEREKSGENKRSNERGEEFVVLVIRRGEFVKLCGMRQEKLFGGVGAFRL